MDQTDAVSRGRLLTRFYLRDQDTYVYSRDGSPAARAVATVFADKYYMGNYLGVTFSYWKGEQNGDQIPSDESRRYALQAMQSGPTLWRRKVRSWIFATKQ